MADIMHLHSSEVLEKLINHVGHLMNAIDPYQEINRMMALELTINPEAVEMDYPDILALVINKLVDFYHDEELKRLWTDFLIIQEEELLSGNIDEIEGDDEEAA